MEALMERNSEGKVRADGKEIRVPESRLALSVVGINQIVGGGDYREDGWIYLNDKPVKKWFTGCSGSSSVRIWGPVLNNIPLLEARKWRIKDRVDDFRNKIWRPLYDEVVKLGEAHAKPTHKYTGTKQWWRYYRNDYANAPSSLSFDWVDEPAEPKNFGIGQQYYHMDQQIGRYYKYLYKFNTVLGSAIVKYLEETVDPKLVSTVRLSVNGRDYWYASESTRHGVARWSRINWPESPLVEIIMGV